MSIFGQDDPLAEMHSMSIGNRGIDGALKAWNDGTEEVRDLLKYEAEMIFECRYCRNLYRSIPTFLSHKRQYCKTLCRTVLPEELISKHLEEFSSLLANDKNTPSKRNVTRSRHNIAASYQKKLQTTTIEDALNRVDLYSLPSISRYQPQTTFKDGQQIIIQNNPGMAIKEHQPEDGALLVMPQESNVSQKCGEMTLRRRKLVDVQEKEMTGKELIVLDYIPADIRKHINPAACQCLYDSCEEYKPFGSLFALAYHLTLTHNRPLSAKEISRLRKGREGQLLCFLCGTTHGGRDKLKTHILKEHSNIREAHINQRNKAFESLPSKTKRKLDAPVLRHRSISPTFSENGKEGGNKRDEETEEAEDETESMDLGEEDSNDSITSAKSQTEAPKPQRTFVFPQFKKKKRARLTLKRKKPPVRKSDKDFTPTEPPPKLVKQHSEFNDDAEAEGEMEPQNNDNGGGDGGQKEASTTPESQQHAPELASQGNSKSPSRTRSPSNDSESQGLAQGRGRRTHRRPLKFQMYENIIGDDTSRKNRGKSKEPPKKKHRNVADSPKLLTPKREIPDEDMPVLQSQQPELSAPNPTPRLTFLLGKAQQRSTAIPTPKKRSPVKPSKLSPTKTALMARLKDTLKSEFDSEWVTPDSAEEALEASDRMPRATPSPKKKGAPYTPIAAELREGSSRRKQRLNISDDNEHNTLKRVESDQRISRDDEKISHPSTKPADLSTLPILLTPEDEKIFFKPLKPLFKDGNDGNHQCSECAAVLLSIKEGRQHMLTHIRAARFRCALCDVGAFYCEDMRTHLMGRHCPSLHLVPEKYQNNDIPCMTVREADELTKIVNPEFPGQYKFTSGKIVTSENPKPHRPDSTIERSILGPMVPPSVSPRKEQRAKMVPILSRSNKSPSRLISLTSAALDNSNGAASSSSQKATRERTPIIPSKGDDEMMASTSSKGILKLASFKILKPFENLTSSDSQTSTQSEDTAPSISSTWGSLPIELEGPSAATDAPTAAPESQSPLPAEEPAAASPVFPEAPMIQLQPPEPEPAPPSPPAAAAPIHQAMEDVEPSDPVPSDPTGFQQPRSLDPVDPSPSY